MMFQPYLTVKNPIPEVTMTTHPNSLTRHDLSHFRQLLADGRISQIYDELAAKGYRYARLANGVVRGDTFSGRIALEFLAKTAEDREQSLSGEDIDAIRMTLVTVYLDTLSLQFSAAKALVIRDVLADEVWNFHAAVFQDRGLGPDAWTLHIPFTLMEAETRTAYWAAVLDSAGHFTQEVQLGLTTDLLMKHAALDLFAPKEAEQARIWLRRLHNLDTYQAVSEVAGRELEGLASALPAPISQRSRCCLDTAAVKDMLHCVDRACLDEPLNTKLSAMYGRIMGSSMPFG
jgi:hypothetical protein